MKIKTINIKKIVMILDKKNLKTQIEHLKEKITNWTTVTFKTSLHQEIINKWKGKPQIRETILQIYSIYMTKYIIHLYIYSHYGYILCIIFHQIYIWYTIYWYIIYHILHIILCIYLTKSLYTDIMTNKIIFILIFVQDSIFTLWNDYTSLINYNYLAIHYQEKAILL